MAYGGMKVDERQLRKLVVEELGLPGIVSVADDGRMTDDESICSVFEEACRRTGIKDVGLLLARAGYVYLDGVYVLDPPKYRIQFDPGTLWDAGVFVERTFRNDALELTLRLHDLQRTDHPLQIMWCRRIEAIERETGRCLGELGVAEIMPQTDDRRVCLTVVDREGEHTETFHYAYVVSGHSPEEALARLARSEQLAGYVEFACMLSLLRPRGIDEAMTREQRVTYWRLYGLDIFAREFTGSSYIPVQELRKAICTARPYLALIAELCRRLGDNEVGGAIATDLQRVLTQAIDWAKNEAGQEPPTGLVPTSTSFIGGH